MALATPLLPDGGFQAVLDDVISGIQRLSISDKEETPRLGCEKEPKQVSKKKPK